MDEYMLMAAIKQLNKEKAMYNNEIKKLKRWNMTAIVIIVILSSMLVYDKLVIGEIRLILILFAVFLMVIWLWWLWFKVVAS